MAAAGCCSRLRQCLFGGTALGRKGGKGKDDPAPELQADWDAAGAADDGASIIVRAISGNVVFEQEGIKPDMPISKLIGAVCKETGTDAELTQLCSGASVLRPGQRLGDCVAPPGNGQPLELSLLRLPGPMISVQAMSGRRIQVLDTVPELGERCHFDRDYTFRALGDFAGKPGMHYILTSNGDKGTPSENVMWRLKLQAPATVYLNFRSTRHVLHTGASSWLEQDGWTTSTMKSTVSTGVPHGPYHGPVYSRSVEPGEVDLRGSNCEEGTYFVFVQLET